MVFTENTKIGFVGYGHIGHILLNGFITSDAIKPSMVSVFDISTKRTDILKKNYPQVTIYSSNTDLIANSDVLFVCVKPLDVLNVLIDIKNVAHKNIHVVTVAAAISFSNVESIFTGSVTKVIPSVASEIKEGVTLVSHNNKVNTENKTRIEELFLNIGSIKVINEEDFEAGTDITSCGPGIISAIFQEYVEAATRNSNFSKDEVTKMVLQTLFGTAELLYKNKETFKDIINTVATKGGITEVGVKQLKQELPPVFDNLFNTTLQKHISLKEMISQQFDEYFKKDRNK